MRTSRKERIFFTLIELLIVIAIIAILASMLLPALNKARGRGRSVHCSNQFRNIVQGAMQYTDASKDFWPTGGGYGIKVEDPAATSGWVDLALLRSILGIGGIGSKSWPKRYICPESWSNKLLAPRPGFNYTEDCAYMQWSAGTGYFSGQPCKITRVKNVSSKVAWADMLTALTYATIAATYAEYVVAGADTKQVDANGPVAYRHDRKANFVFMDGHISSLDDNRARALANNPFRPLED